MLCASVDQLTRLPQDIRYHFKKQDIFGVLWEHGVHKICCLARVVSFRPSVDRGLSSAAGRRFQPVRDGFTTEVQGGSRRIGHHFWFVAVLVPIPGGKFRGLLIMEMLRRVRIPRRYLVHVSHGGFGIDSRDRCRRHDIFPRHGRFTDIHPNCLHCHVGTIFRSFPTPFCDH